MPSSGYSNAKFALFSSCALASMLNGSSGRMSHSNVASIGGEMGPGFFEYGDFASTIRYIRMIYD
jgi:hypothetical protein